MIGISAVYALLEKGKRQKLEDYIYPSISRSSLAGRTFIVCDGVGGENAGEIASKIVAETFASSLSDPLLLSLKGELKESLRQAQAKFEEYIGENPLASNMSTTLTIACFKNHEIEIAWCGDSKIYHIRDNQVIWKSKDHSLVQQLIDMGEITELEAKIHPKRNIILRSVSSTTKPESIDYHSIGDVRAGDFLLLASDGIFEQIDDGILTQVLSDTEEDKAKLIYEKCKDKTQDNFSMYLLKLGVQDQRPTSRKWLIFALLLIALSGLIYFIISKIY